MSSFVGGSKPKSALTASRSWGVGSNRSIHSDSGGTAIESVDSPEHVRLRRKQFSRRPNERSMVGLLLGDTLELFALL
jgi:hypothetical protein